MKRDIEALYGGLEAACTENAGLKCIVDHEDARDGLLTWMSMLNSYKHEGDKDTKIDKL